MLSSIKKYWLNYVVRTLFERIPVVSSFFGLFNGYKTIIGRIGVFLSIVIYGMAYEFPQIPHITQIYSTYAMILSWAFEQLGVQHRIDKEEREKLFTDEFSGVS